MPSQTEKHQAGFRPKIRLERFCLEPSQNGVLQPLHSSEILTRDASTCQVWLQTLQLALIDADLLP